MALYRRGNTWWMDFRFHGARIQESTGMTSITRAKEVYEKRKQGLKDGAAGLRKHERPQVFSVAAEKWAEIRKANGDLAPTTIRSEEADLKHLKPVFGRLLVSDIGLREIARYKQTRQSEGAARKTVNLELGTLRSILGPQLWINLRVEAKKAGAKLMYKVRDDEHGRALTAEEESALLLECGRSRSRILLPFVVLALNTGARFNTIRTLQWKNIDFTNLCLKFGHDKTAAGTNRTVPLNQRAMTALTFWAQQFPNRQPSHYVFPSEKAGGGGREDTFGFTAGSVAYKTNPSEPIGDIKEAWEAARKRTRRHCPQCRTGILAVNPKGGHACIDCNFEVADLPAGLTGVRFHDLRHSAVSRLIAAGVPIPMIAKIVGWSQSTMAKMAARYGHFTLDTLRDAMENLTPKPSKGFEFDEGKDKPLTTSADIKKAAGGRKADFRGESLQFSLHREGNSGMSRAN
jgi:integrase